MPDLALGLPRTLGLLLVLGATLGALTVLARPLAPRVRWWWAPAVALLALLAVLPRLVGSEILAPPIPNELLPGRTDPAELSAFATLNDVLQQLLPWEIEVRRALADGAPPFWSFRLGCGESLWANPQAQVLSVVALLARWFPLASFLLVALAIKTGIAALGAAALASRLGARAAAALLAGTVFALGGGIQAWGLFPLSSTLCWVPWFTLALLAWTRDGDGRRSRPLDRPLRRLAAPVTGAALLLGGHPETAAFGGLLALTIALAARRRGLPWSRFLLRLGVAGALCVALAAPHLLPLAASVRDSRRLAETAGRALIEPWTHGPIALVFDPASWKRLLAPAGPTVFGVPYHTAFTGPFHWAEADGGYAGLVALAGLALWLAAGPSRRHGWLGWIWLTSLLLGAGFRPFLLLMQELPLVGSLYPARAVPVGTLAAALVAGFGWQALRRGRRRLQASVALALTAAASLALAPGGGAVATWVAIAVIAAFVVGQRARPKRRLSPVLVPAVVVALAALELAAWDWHHLPAVAREDVYPATHTLDLLAAASAASPGARAVGLAYAAYPNVLAVYGISDVRPHSPLARNDLLELLGAGFGFAPTSQVYFAPFSAPSATALARLAVRWVVLPKYQAALPNGLPRGLVPWPGKRLLATNPEALPLVYPARETVCIDRRELATWLATDDDPRTVAILAEDGCDHGAAWATATAEVSLIANGVDVRIARSQADGPVFLASSLPADPGWRLATERGSLRPHKVFGAFLGAAVTPEDRIVRLRYWPPGLTAGLVLAGLALAVLISGRVPG